LDKKKLFTPNQIFACTFFGGPMAMIYALWKNFQVLERPRDAQQILFWGSLFVVTLLLFAPFIPDWAEIAIPIGYSVAARSIAANHQMRKDDILVSQAYARQPIVNVAAIAIVFFLGFVLITFAFIFVLVSTGVLEP
jgi:hypothetical protein